MRVDFAVRGAQIKMRGGPLGKLLRGSRDLTAVSTWTGLLQVVL